MARKRKPTVGANDESKRKLKQSKVVILEDSQKSDSILCIFSSIHHCLLGSLGFTFNPIMCR